MKPHRLAPAWAFVIAMSVWMQVTPAAAQTAPGPATPQTAAPAASAADAAADPAMAATIAAASTESDRWLRLIDQGKFDESWVAAATVLQESLSRDEWTADLKARRPKIGRTIMRERKSASYSRTLRGAPTGDYVIITYLTKYEKTPLAQETLAVAKDALGLWHVAGYDIALASVDAMTAPPPNATAPPR